MKRFSGLLLCVGLVGCGVGSLEVESDQVGALDAELGATLTPGKVTLSNGVEMAYAVQGNPHGKPVILIHGYPDSHHTWDLNYQTLSRNYRVYGIDLRGLGSSSKNHASYTQADLSEDVVLFMNALGIQKATLVGHSMGSLVAHRVAAFWPNRVERLVLVSSATTTFDHWAAHWIRQVLTCEPFPLPPEEGGCAQTMTDEEWADFVWYFQWSTFYQPVPDAYLNTMVEQSLGSPRSVWLAIIEGMLEEDHVAKLADITAPTLILHGDQDVLFSVEDAQALKAAIPNATLKIYADTGHGLHAERPTQFRQDLHAFLP